MTAPLSLRCRLDNAEAFELLEPLREKRAGEPGRTLENLAEGLTAQLTLRMINGVQRSAKISAPRAIGQYWP